MKVAVYIFPGSKRSELIANAMLAGVRAAGDEPELRHGLTYKGPDADAAVFYGLMRDVLNGYRDAGKKAVYVDLGYWGRHEGGRRAGFHKVSVNARHPTAYFQAVEHPGDRFDRFGVQVHPRRGTGPKKYVMIAGMSAKAAHAEGLRPEEWERKVAVEIRRHTDREIVYRPKPNWREAQPIPGTRFLRGNDGDVEGFLDNCHAVVTHHSNVAVDALLYGVPAYVVDGVAVPAQPDPLRAIDAPYMPPVPWVRQFANDLAYTQWKVSEIEEGACWRHLREEGLV